MSRLICAFVVRIWQKQAFSWHSSYMRSASPVCKYDCIRNTLARLSSTHIYVQLKYHHSWVLQKCFTLCLFVWKSRWYANSFCVRNPILFISPLSSLNRLERELLYLSWSFKIKEVCGNVQTIHSVNILSHVMRKPVLFYMRPTKAQISLRVRAVWSAP